MLVTNATRTANEHLFCVVSTCFTLSSTAALVNAAQLSEELALQIQRG